MNTHSADTHLARRAAAAVALLVAALACLALGTGSALASPADPTTSTVVTVSPSAVGPGDAVTLTAVVTGVGGNPTGTVTFGANTSAGSIVIGSATLTPVAGSTTTSQASLTTTSFAAGTYAITGTYRSDDIGSYFNSTSPGAPLNVSSIALHNTTTTVSATPTSVTAGQAVVLTAVVAESDGGTTIPTGAVTFSEGNVLLGTATLDAAGVAHLNVPSFLSGTHVITASYVGDIVDHSSSGMLTLVVAPGASSAVATTTTVQVVPARIVAGQSVTITAHVVQTGTATAPPAGAVVNFTANGVYIGQGTLDASGNATLTVSGWVSGTYTIRASYLGDINDLPSLGDAQLGVNPSATPLTITAPSASFTYGGTVPVLAPVYSGFAPGDTSASLTTPATCTTTATATSPAGTYPVTCSGASSPLYTFTYVNTGTVTVLKAPLTVTANNATVTAGQPIPALTTTITGFKNGQTLATSGVTGSPSCTTTATTSSPAGTYPITCTIGTLAAANYSFTTFTAGTLTVTAAPPTTTCTAKHPDPRAHCESLLANPSECQGATVSAGQKLSILFSDENPIGTGSLAPSAVLSNGQVLPITVTATSHQSPNYVTDNGGSPSSKYQSLLSFTLPANLAPGTYSILITVHDSAGNTDQWVWQLKVKAASSGGGGGYNPGHDDDNDCDWLTLLARVLAALGCSYR